MEILRPIPTAAAAMTPLPLRVGTAGWSVPSRCVAEVPPGGSHLERYARRLNAVEINSSFYRPHQRKTYEQWAQSTPNSFRFSVKMPKAMTHEQRLADCGALLDRFVAEVTGLGDRLGVLLVQLPPKLALEERVAGGFFRNLRKRIDVRIARVREYCEYCSNIDNQRRYLYAGSAWSVIGAGIPKALDLPSRASIRSDKCFFWRRP